MTGNSMDAIDLVLTEFDGDVMTDIYTYTKPYAPNMQKRMEALRAAAFAKTRLQIESMPEFQTIHDDYIRQIGACINEMLEQNKIAKEEISAIGFHGKTLDHNPPSVAKTNGSKPYTLQMGSGQMLADITGIPVVYDFRSDLLMNGFEGAPLVSEHNAHIAASEGDGCYYNGGNTSNFALIVNGKAVFGSDAGPFNEYTDNYIRQHSDKSFDKDGRWGQKGQLQHRLLQKIFAYNDGFLERSLPKSGDPAYYHKEEIFQFVAQEQIEFVDAVRTFEYSAAYIAAFALSLIDQDINLPSEIILFGGGWKNPVVKTSFADLLQGKGFVLSEHKDKFAALTKRLGATPIIKQSNFGDYMEARLFADMARYKLENKAWEIPETQAAGKKIVCGRVAYPQKPKGQYSDCLNRAAKGWQKEKIL